MILNKSAIGLLIACAFIMTGCGSKASNVIGVWSGEMNRKGRDFAVSAEFFSDNSLTFKVNGENLTDGKWIVLSDGRLKVDFSTDGSLAYTLLKDGGGPVIFGEIQNSTLILDCESKGKISLAK